MPSCDAYVNYAAGLSGQHVNESSERFVDFWTTLLCSLGDICDTMALLSSAILVLFLVTATVVLLPQLSGSALGLVFRGVGWLIRRRTRSRREYVIARARSEDKEKGSSNSLARSQADDSDWEKVDSSGPGGVKTASSSESGASAGGEDAEWSGIVGFFHPFWYA